MTWITDSPHITKEVTFAELGLRFDNAKSLRPQQVGNVQTQTAMQWKDFVEDASKRLGEDM